MLLAERRSARRFQQTQRVPITVAWERASQWRGEDPTLGTFSHRCQSAQLQLLISVKRVTAIKPIVFFRARRNRELCSTQHALRINIEANFMPLRRVWSDKEKRRGRSRFHPVCVVRLCAIIMLAICWAGCEERSQQLEERVTQLEKELNRTQDELRSTKQALEASNAELTRLKAAASSASAPVAPSPGVAEAKPSAPVAQNQSAPAQRPATSSLPADRSVTIQWPGSSGASALPNQPANQNAPAPAPGNAAANAAVIVPQRSGATGAGGAGNRTVVIQWPNNNAAAPSANQPSAPSGAANPPARPVQQPAPNNATGRSDRTVIIQWPGSGQSPGP